VHDVAARLYGWARVGLGLVLAVAPAPAARLWIGEIGGAAELRGPLRALAVRDLALGVAVLRARDDSARRDALLLCAVVDVGDAVFSGIDFGRTRRPGAGITALGAFGAAGLAAAAALAAHRRAG
jgi:hypothetical protein